MTETFEYLTSKYNKASISRTELSEELGVSLSTIDRQLSQGIGLPDFKRIGNGKRARIVFPLKSVACFIETELIESRRA